MRTDLGLTGTKYGCGEGLCGACTVVVGKDAVRSCKLPVKAVRGKDITTIEGLEQNGKLHPLQEAFAETGDIVAAARYGGASGALTCTKLGAQPSLPSAAEIDALMAEQG